MRGLAVGQEVLTRLAANGDVHERMLGIGCKLRKSMSSMEAIHPTVSIQSNGANGTTIRFPLTSLSLVVPAFNEQASIKQSIQEATAALGEIVDRFEILVIDDGSTDDTASVVEEIATQNPHVRLLRQPENMGYGAALQRGFQAATMDYVSFTDADCQFDLRELDRLIFLARDYDVVCGFCINRQDNWIRDFYSKTYNLIVRTLLGVRVRDIDCAMKLFRREVIQSIPLTSPGFFVNCEILTEANLRNLRMVEVGVTHRPRAAGESKVHTSHIVSVTGSILRYWWNRMLFPHATHREVNRAEESKFPVGIAGLVLAILCIVTFALNLDYPLIEPDETRYVQIALEMIESGSWITPTLWGEPYFEKPPLLYWMTATSIKLFGVNQWCVRLPSVIAAILTVLSLFLIGRHLVGPIAAWCGAMCLILSGGFVLAGRFVIMDMLLTYCVTLSWLYGYRAMTRRSPTLWYATSVACAMGVLAKGPVAICLCVPPMVAYRWLSKSHGATLRHWIQFTTIVFAITSPWYLLVSIENPEFWHDFFWKHHVSRFTSGLNHVEPFWFYIPVLFGGTFPASMLVPFAVYFLLSRHPQLRQMRHQEMGFLLLVSLWIVVFFSLSRCKLPTYILPAVPPLALGLGSFVKQIVWRQQVRHSVVTILQAFPRRSIVIYALSGLVLVVLSAQWITRVWGTAEWIVLTCCGITLVMTAIYWRDRVMISRTGWTLSSVGAVALTMYVFLDFVPKLASTRSVHRAAVSAWRQDPTQPVVYFDYAPLASEMYLPNDAVRSFRIDQTSELAQFVQTRPRAVIVSSRRAKTVVDRALAAMMILESGGAREHVMIASQRRAHELRLTQGKVGSAGEKTR